MVLNTTTPPVLSIAKIHSGVFPPGQPNVYTVTIANASGLGPTSGPVTVTETPPAGLTVVSMSGVGWTCASGSLACSRSDVAASGAGYPPITVAVNVASTASSPQVNAVTVSGGGSANATATDSTTVLSSPLSIASTHSGSFIQGQQNAAYTLTVSNAASGTATIGAVMVTDSVSSGLALLSMSGPGWTCGSGAGGMTCGRGDPLAASASYPPITALVSVSPAASSPQVNTVSLSGSGAPMATATDSAAIVPPITGTLAEYPLAFAGSAPGGIAAGPDGALWFTEKANSKTGRISTNGAVTEYSPPTPQSTPAGIAAGPDGALWFTEEGAGQIGRITAAGAVTEYHASGLGDFPTGIAAGPDVALWYTELNGNRIGRISTGGTSIEYPLPTVSSGPTAIAAGPDGALWFTESYANQIGRITTGGAINEYPVPTAGSNPAGIAAGPDGALWFTENSSGNIGRISTDGAITEYPAGDGGPQGIALGPDGALWFTESIVSAIGRIDPSGVVSQTPLTITENTSPQPSAIAAGPDGGLWFTELSGRIGRLAIAPALSISCTHFGDFVRGSKNNMYWLTVSNQLGAALPSGATVMVTDTLPSNLSSAGTLGTGWSCNGTVCTRSDGLAAGASYPPILVAVGIESETPSPVVNQATVSYAGSRFTATDSTAIIPVSSFPAFRITKTHAGNFLQGQQGAEYTIVLSNTGGSATSGIVVVQDLLPPGLTLVSMTGAGWTCSGNICTRSDALTPGAAYPPVMVSVNVAPNATSPQVNIATTDGGGAYNPAFAFAASTSDSTIITSAVLLSITVTHGGSFPQGAPQGYGYGYLITVFNQGTTPTGGTVTVTDIPSAALSLGLMNGIGWTCNSNTCSRSDPLPSGSSYPSIFAEVGVAANATSPQSDTVTASGGGSPPASASDPTLITPVIAGAVAEYPVPLNPINGGGPEFITLGPDGALWFTTGGQGDIGRITTSGSILLFPAGGSTADIGVGPDGALWFGVTGMIGRIATSGAVTEYPSTAGYDFTTGPDGALWFTNPKANAIGRMVNGSVVSEFPIPTAQSGALSIVTGPDGALWFTERSAGQIARITTSGVITEYPVPTIYSTPWGITTGPDGALWFTESINATVNNIGRITTAGAITEFRVPTLHCDPGGITVGSDGALWFTETSANQIGRLTTSGSFSEYALPSEFISAGI